MEAEKGFNDLIAGVEYLKRESGILNIDPNKIAFYGVSFGALSGAVVLNRKRDLFRTVIFQNGNLDLISQPNNGHLNNKDDFDCIKTHAPFLHIQKPTTCEESYPVTLIVASKNDNEVPFEQSLKYLAHRREKAVNNEFQREKPTFLQVINSGGHNYRSATKKEYVDTVFVKLQFLAETMELKFGQKYKTNYFAVSDVPIEQG